MGWRRVGGRAAIDNALANRPADFPAFLSLMEQVGYEVKQRRGVISFRAPGQERFPRLRSDALGEGCSETDIRAALSKLSPTARSASPENQPSYS